MIRVMILCFLVLVVLVARGGQDSSVVDADAATLIFSLGGVVGDQDDIDITTGLPPSEIAQRVPEPMTSVKGGGNILWDTSHGIYLDYSPSGRFSNLKSVLEEKGYTVDENSSGVLSLDLGSYNIIVISLGSAWDSAYSPEEVAAIHDFVNSGGGLLIMGDNPGTPNGNINPVAQTFGTTLGISTIGPFPYDTYITNLTAHPIFGGVSAIYMKFAGEISGSPPSSEEAYADTGEAVVTVAESGSGRVVALGDFNLMANNYIFDSDNQLFSENVFDWLAEPGASSCTLELDVSYADGTLTMDFVVGTAGGSATWGVWVFVHPQIISLWSIPLPVIDPPVSPSASFPLPNLGIIGFITILTTSEGIICWDVEVVDTGPVSPDTEPTIEKLKGLFPKSTDY